MELDKVQEDIEKETVKMTVNKTPHKHISELTNSITSIVKNYYAHGLCDLQELENAYDDIRKKLEEDPHYDVFMLTASAYINKAEGKGCDPKDIALCYSKSIEIYDVLLKTTILPIQRAEVLFSQGGSYSSLSHIRDMVTNSKKAIKAYLEALKVYTPKDFPMQYAMTQNNLGNAYRQLGEVEDKEANIKKAIDALEEALKVYTREEYPDIYKELIENIKSLRKKL